MEDKKKINEKELERVSGGTGPRGLVGECSYTCPFCKRLHYFSVRPLGDGIWHIADHWDFCEDMSYSAIVISAVNIPVGGTLEIDYDCRGKITYVPFYFIRG